MERSRRPSLEGKERASDALADGGFREKTSCLSSNATLFLSGICFVLNIQELYLTPKTGSVYFLSYLSFETATRSLCTSLDSETLQLSIKQSDHNFYLSHQEESEKCRQNQFLLRKKIVKRSGMRSPQISQSRFN